MSKEVKTMRASPSETVFLSSRTPTLLGMNEHGINEVPINLDDSWGRLCGQR